MFFTVFNSKKEISQPIREAKDCFLGITYRPEPGDGSDVSAQILMLIIYIQANLADIR